MLSGGGRSFCAFGLPWHCRREASERRLREAPNSFCIDVQHNERNSMQSIVHTFFSQSLAELYDPYEDVGESCGLGSRPYDSTSNAGYRPRRRCRRWSRSEGGMRRCTTTLARWIVNRPRGSYLIYVWWITNYGRPIDASRRVGVPAPTRVANGLGLEAVRTRATGDGGKLHARWPGIGGTCRGLRGGGMAIAAECGINTRPWTMGYREQWSTVVAWDVHRRFLSTRRSPTFA